MTKVCTKCGEAKPLDAFALSRRQKDGRFHWCRACDASERRRRIALDPEAYRIKERLRKAAQYEKDRSRLLARNQGWKDRSAAHISAYNKAHYAAQKVRYQARTVVNRAVKSGALAKPETCNRCAARKPLQGHHHSYAKEHWLDVEWLCRACHLRHHAQEKAA